MKKYSVEIIMVIVIVVMLFGVLFWNYISKEQAEKKRQEEKATETLNSIEASNVSIVDAKLGSDYRISQDYLIKYTRKKSSIWYLSQARVKNIKEDGTNSVMILTNDIVDLIVNISSDRVNVAKNDEVYFVGTIDLSDGSIDLAKISKDEINYSSAIKLEFSELVNNIELVKKTHFQVSGYLVTDKDKYKLFDSKDAYKKDSSVGTFFNISWKNEFNYTGNQDVLVDCVIADTYKLSECEIIEK